LTQPFFDTKSSLFFSTSSRRLAPPLADRNCTHRGKLSTNAQLHRWSHCRERRRSRRREATRGVPAALAPAAGACFFYFDFGKHSDAIDRVRPRSRIREDGSHHERKGQGKVGREGGDAFGHSTRRLCSLKNLFSSFLSTSTTTTHHPKFPFSQPTNRHGRSSHRRSLRSAGPPLPSRPRL